MPPATIDFTNASGHTVHVEGCSAFHTRSALGGSIGVLDKDGAHGEAQVYARGAARDEHFHFLRNGETVIVHLETGEKLVVSKP